MAGKGILIALVAVVVIAGAILAAYNQDLERAATMRMHGTVPTDLGSPLLGDPGAPVTIVEFGDYQCHGCHNWFHNTKPSITRDYIEQGTANMVFVDIAFLGEDSRTAARASYCADDQGRYWDYHDRLYNEQLPEIDGGWASRDNLVAFAEDMGMDAEEFAGCLDSSRHADRIASNERTAKNHGVASTPGFIIVGSGGQSDLITGAQPYLTFKLILDEMI